MARCNCNSWNLETNSMTFAPISVAISGVVIGRLCGPCSQLVILGAAGA